MEYLGLAFVVHPCISASSKKWKRSRLEGDHNRLLFQQWSLWTWPLSNLVGKSLSTQNAEGRQPQKKRAQEHLLVQLKMKVTGLQTSKGKVATCGNS